MAGFSPTELLNLTEEEQAIVRCLTRSPQLTEGEIAAQLQIPPRRLVEVLEQMVRATQLDKNYDAGEPTFSVHFRREIRPQRSKSSVFDLFDE